MKTKYISKIVFAGALALTAVSCSLDYDPISEYSEKHTDKHRAPTQLNTRQEPKCSLNISRFTRNFRTRNIGISI
jgi:hypothetical protein